MILKAIKRAGLEKDPVWRELKSLDDLHHESTRAWILSRYRKTCAGCAERFYTSPRTLPVCPKCWGKVPLEGALWWWKSKGSQRSFEKFLDEYFDGGYDVPADPKQLRS